MHKGSVQKHGIIATAHSSESAIKQLISQHLSNNKGATAVCTDSDGSFTCDCFSTTAFTLDADSITCIGEWFCKHSRSFEGWLTVQRSKLNACHCTKPSLWNQPSQLSSSAQMASVVFLFYVLFHAVCRWSIHILVWSIHHHPGYIVSDKDECALGTHACSCGLLGGCTVSCVNTDGGYDCVCSDGYTANGFTCESMF